MVFAEGVSGVESEPPAKPVQFVLRRRVFERIRTALQRPVALILAPAGYGKSIAVQQFLEHAGFPYVHLNAGIEHQTLPGFVSELAHACRSIAPQILEAVLSELQDDYHHEATGEAMAALFARHIDDYKGTVVIDDFHIAASDPRTPVFLRSLIERTKERTRWLVGSRLASHFPISAWLASGTIDVPIDEKVLRFTTEDAREAAWVIDSTIEARDIDRLLNLTAGWPTAFGLAVRILSVEKDFVQAAVRARHLSYEYLAEHVYQTLSDDERALLHFGSLLPAFDLDLLEAAGFSRARETLHELNTRAAFVTLEVVSEYAPTARHYRCHDLFRDFLQHRAKLEGPDFLQSLQLRAARLLLDNGDAAAALRLYTAGRAHLELLALLETHGIRLIDDMRAEAVFAAIEALPADVQREHPVALGIRAELCVREERFTRAESLFERAIARAEQPEYRAQLIYLFSVCRLRSGNTSDARSGFQSIVDMQAPAALRGSALACILMTDAAMDNAQALTPMFDELARTAAAVDSEIDRGHMLARAGFAAVYCGDSARALELLNTALEIAERLDSLRLKRLIHGSLTYHALFREDDLKKAVALAAVETQIAEQLGTAWDLRGAAIRQLAVGIRLGEEERIASILRAYGQLPKTEDSSIRALIDEARAVLCAWQGDDETAFELMLAALPQIFPLEQRALDGALCALFAISIGNLDAASHSLKLAIQTISSPAPRNVHVAKNMKTAAFFCIAGYALLGKSIEGERIVRSFGEPTSVPDTSLLELARLFSRADDSALRTQRIRRPLEQIRTAGYAGYARIVERAARTKAPQDGNTVLTPAETAVLASLAAGFAPKEIALMKNTSVNTVRVHIRRIIAKLGCSGKEQAVSVARSRGMI